MRYCIMILFPLLLCTMAIEAVELPTGARPIGLAAFSAIADDANAVKWNPAGMIQLDRQEVTAMWTDLFRSGFTQGHLGYVLPVSNQLALGVDWMGIRYADQELGYRQDRIHVASAFRLFNSLSLGFNAKWYSGSTHLDDIHQGSVQRLDGDLGILFWPVSGLQGAVVLHNVVNTPITHKHQGQIHDEPISERQIVGGIAYHLPITGSLLAAEMDLSFNNHLRIGYEHAFQMQEITATIRAGLDKDWGTEGRPAWSVGGTLGVPASSHAHLLLEYAYLDSPVLPPTHRVALRVPFDFSPTLVEITQVDIPHMNYIVQSEEETPIFVSSLLPYDRKAHLVTVHLRNKHHSMLTLSIKLSLGDYITQAVVAPNVVLLPQEAEGGVQEATHQVEAVDIQVLLPKELLSLQTSKSLPVTIQVDYEGIKRYTPAKQTLSLALLKPGWIPMNMRGQVLMPFIDPADPVVHEFANHVVAEYAQDELHKALPPSAQSSEDSLFLQEAWRKILKAVQIYESLRQLGIRYVSDSQFHYGKVVFDEVKYPRELLTSAEKTGDCDDYSVLFAALCESVGIQTALIEIPGHVFTLINTGLYAGDVGLVSQSSKLGLPENRFVRVKGTNNTEWDELLAIPVDPSAETDDSFVEAWKNGLQTYRENQGSAQILVVREESRNHAPVHPLLPEVTSPKIDDFDSLSRLLRENLGAIQEWQDTQKSELQPEIEQLPW